ncbi:DUF1345 domain-containing protein [Micromonospora sp. NBC_01699]|uniref:DUF1345 domain-containing protein n=1 Tax=Micromonospora sp. NBC_01699 TaxID=2975984 RepID=UPI002E2BB0B2|nr:DUF1345 domain-containing protein [Micromonospora sp. NBC_01699]
MLSRLPAAAQRVRAGVELAVVAIIGLCVGVPVGVLYSPILGPLAGWDAAAIAYLLWIWTIIWPMGPEQTARLALREDPSRTVRDLLLLGACLVSLVAIGFVLAEGNPPDLGQPIRVGAAIVSIVVSWSVVHTVFTARYARLYYTGVDGGIEFHQTPLPRYVDFAYVAFTVGLTFQVSDTDLTTTEMRATVLRHALLAYLFGAVIVGAAINLVAGLAHP